MMQNQAEKEGNQRIDGLSAFFGRGPPPADPHLFWDFTALTFLQRLNSSLLILSSFSLLLGIIAYVYGAALAMIAPILCHLWLQLNVTMFRQALHYLIFMVAYGVSLVAITISSIVWMAFMANKDNMSKHTTVRLARNNERLFVVVIWFILQLLIAVLGGFLLYLAFLAYKLQKAASEGQGHVTSELQVESGTHKAYPAELRVAPLESRQSHAAYREERHQDQRQHSPVQARRSPTVHPDERTNMHYDSVYDEVHDTRMGRHAARNEHAHDDVDRNHSGDVPRERAPDTRHTQHSEKGLHKTTISVGTVPSKAVEDETRHVRSTEKTDDERPSSAVDLEPTGADPKQISQTSKPSENTPKSARFAKNPVVHESVIDERKANERDDTLPIRNLSSEHHSPHQDHNDRRHSTSSSSSDEHEGDRHSGHASRTRYSSSSSAEERHKK